MPPRGDRSSVWVLMVLGSWLIGQIGNRSRSFGFAGGSVRVEANPAKEPPPMKQSTAPKARILRESDGLVRLICEAGSGRVLGVHMLGPHVTDLIAEGALAVQAGLTADDLAWTTHAHPTLPEAMLEAALGFRDAAIHAHSR